MALKLSGHHIFSEDPIIVIDLLTRFVREANILKMSEAYVLTGLFSLPKWFAKSQYEAGVEMEKEMYQAG